MNVSKLAFVCASAGVALALAGPAGADGYEVAAPAAEEARKLVVTFNLDGTSDYVFRGVSQTLNKPTIQGGGDLSYGILYAGV